VRPFEDGSDITWERAGNKIDLLFDELKEQIELKNINSQLLELLQSKYSPINSKGKVNQGYLYSVNDLAGKYLIDKIELNEKVSIEEKFLDNVANSDIDNTTKTTIVESRVGQGEYRTSLLKLWDSKCSLSGIELTDILIASHCKPWKYSNNHERRDPENGLLLAATYDKLFDRGFITFDNDGKIIVSKQLSLDIMGKVNLSMDSKLLKMPTEKLTNYLEFHRRIIFKG